MFINVKEKIG